MHVYIYNSLHLHNLLKSILTGIFLCLGVLTSLRVQCEYAQPYNLLKINVFRVSRGRGRGRGRGRKLPRSWDDLI